MGVYTDIQALDANEPEFIRMKEEHEKGLQILGPNGEEWDEYDAFAGAAEDRPGAVIETEEDIYEETGDEYEGWVIDLSQLPKNATHILVTRG